MLGLGINLNKYARGGGGVSYLLDSYGGAAAAYSLRPLSSSWVNQNVIRVRRSLDNAEQNFTPTEITDGTLTTFTGAGDGFVVTWFDQSGSNDVTQSTAGNQPKIVSSGTVITEGSKPAIDFDGVNDGLLTSANIVQSCTEVLLTIVSKNDLTAGQQTMLRVRTNGSFGVVNGFIWEQGSSVSSSRFGVNTGFEAGGNAISASSLGQGTQVAQTKLTTLLYGQSSILAHEDGALSQTLSTNVAGSTPIGTSSINSPLWIGYNFGSSDRPFNGKFQEIVLYLSDQSTNRVAIETNINDYYTIY